MNEARKVQISDVAHFPDAIRTLHELLSCPAWLRLVSKITNIDRILADDEMIGAGIHVYGPGAHLDVHVDFNFIAKARLYRRLNVLVFFNPEWSDEWGGELELWSPDVRDLEHSLAPRMNRCVLFATSDSSFHGVAKVLCPPGISRNSFAGYYYTREAPEDWAGNSHSTVFRARPAERFKRSISMPLERFKRASIATARSLSHRLWHHRR